LSPHKSGSPTNQFPLRPFGKNTKTSLFQEVFFVFICYSNHMNEHGSGGTSFSMEAAPTQEQNDTREIPPSFAARLLDGIPVPDRPIQVQRLAKFGELAGNLREEGRGNLAEGAEKIIGAFTEARTEVELPSGKTVLRKPHLVIAGGFVRDTLLEKTPKDIDFATSLNYAEAYAVLKKKFAAEIERGEVSLVEEAGKNFSVLIARFRDLDQEYEIAAFRIDGDYSDGRRPDAVTPTRYAGSDAERRDLTINALFYNPSTGNVIDYVGGLKDLKEKNLRFVGNAEERISEDRLRMLRYIRFLGKTGFMEDKNVKEVIQKHAHEILGLPAERLHDELSTVLATGSAGDALERLHEYGLLKEILPEVAALADCPQGPPYHMEGDVLKHTTLVANGLPSDASANLRWAAVFHDISKPETRAEEIDQGKEKKVSFLRHAEVGAEKILPILNRLKFSNEERNEIKWLVANHIRMLGEFTNMRESKARELALSPYAANLIALAEADSRGAVPVNPEIKEKNEMVLKSMRERYESIIAHTVEKKEQVDAVTKAVNGNEIISTFKKRHGHKPEGKRIGLLKARILEEVHDNRITDPEEARGVMERIISESVLQ